MKTICPYCKQEFPDTPDEYWETTVECPMCKRGFVAKKAKFCAECGAINPGQAIKCAQCGNFFPALPQQPTESSSVQEYAQESIEYLPSYGGDDCFVEDIDILTPWRKWLSVGHRGRSCRKEYWFFMFGCIIFSLIIKILAPFSLIFAILGLVFGLVGLCVAVSLTLRRMHDIGISGWWLLMFFIPLCAFVLLLMGPAYGLQEDFFSRGFMGGFMLKMFAIPVIGSYLFIGFLLGFWPSQPGANRYGPNPVGDQGGHPYRKLNAGTMLIGIGIVDIILLLLSLIIP